MRAWLLALACTLSMPAWAQYGANDAPTDIALAGPDAAALKVASPLFSRRLGRVSFDVNATCLHCGDFDDGDWVGRRFVDRRYNEDYLRFLKQSLLDSGIFAEDARERLSLQASLVRLEQASSTGRAAEQRSVISSNATLQAKATIRYVLKERDDIVGVWDVTSAASSNSLTSIVRRGETTDRVLQRNLQAFVLQLIASHSPDEAPRARARLAQIESQVDNTRSALSHLIYGAARVVNTGGEALGATVQALAQNQDAVQSALQSVQQTARAQDQAHAQALAAAHGAGGRQAAAAAQVEAAARRQDGEAAAAGAAVDGEAAGKAAAAKGRGSSAVAGGAGTVERGAQTVSAAKPTVSESFVSVYKKDLAAEVGRCEAVVERETRAAREEAVSRARAGQTYGAYRGSLCVITMANNTPQRMARGMTASAQRQACDALRRDIDQLPGVSGTGRSIREYAGDAAYARRYSPSEGCQCTYDHAREAHGEPGNALCTYLAVFDIEYPAR